MGSENYRTVARVGDVLEGQGLPVMLGNLPLAIVLDEGVYYAIDDRCPHKGIPLCDGIVCDKTLTCTWHGWMFSLVTGEWVDNPTIRVGTYPVRVVGDEIQVSLEGIEVGPCEGVPPCPAIATEGGERPVEGSAETVAERSDSNAGATH